MGVKHWTQRLLPDSLATVEPQCLDTTDAAAYLRLSPQLLRTWRMKGGGPRYLKTSPGRRGAVRYHVPDLDAWAESRKVRSTSEVVKGATSPRPLR